MILLLLACVGDKGDGTETGETGDTGVEDLRLCGDWDRGDRQGASWTWAYDDDATWPGGWTTTVTDSFEEDGRTFFVHTTEGVAEPPGRLDYWWTYVAHYTCDEGLITQWWGNAYTYDLQDDGVALESEYNYIYDEGYVVRPIELEVGSTWTSGGHRRVEDASDGGVIVDDIKTKDWEVLSASTVSVPAGDFDSLRASDGEGFVHVVRDVGFVRWEGFSWLLSTDGL